jgi:signal transduction histidine kinase/CheY-like chemotaxis protein
MMIPRKTVISLALPWIAFVSIMSSVLTIGLQFYTEKLSKEFLLSWLQSEAVAIQEGNLLTSLSKNQRVLLSSDVVAGIALVRPDPRQKRTSEKLVELGRPFEISPSNLPVRSGYVEVIRSGLFEAIAVYRIPEDPSLSVAFLAHLRFAPWLLIFFVFFIGIATSFVLFVAYRTIAAEHSTRLHIVKVALSDLVADRPFSSDINISVPGISLAWSALRDRVEELKSEAARQSQLAAVARTTQMLAHDVRKPFSMLEMVIEAISNASTPEETQEIATFSLPEIKQAMASVQGMIQDVMQIGSDSAPNQQSTAPETLIEASVSELFRLFPDAEVSIEYDLKHRHSVFVDTLRVGRVFSNILVNALQAMNGRGVLWFKTKEDASYIEFRLGNVGTHIPEESISKLFDAFFTSGKASGTGLGLAIAQKVVRAHGGNIRCESNKNNPYPQGFVEFIFTLPSANQLSPRLGDPLPKHSQEIHVQITKLKKKDNSLNSAEELELECVINRKIELLIPSIPSVLIVDDEALYRNSIENLFNRGDSFATKIPLIFAQNYAEAIELCRMHNPFLLIQDIDLGLNCKNGIEIIKELRKKNFTGRICVHSNRFLFGDQKIALEAGADTVLPKPMSRAHLLKLISSALPEPAQASELLHSTAFQERIRIAYIDDTKIYTKTWKMRLKSKADVYTFESTEEFFAELSKDPQFFARLDVIVTDFYFGPEDPMDGKSFAHELRRIGFEKPIYLASNGDFEIEDLKPDINGVISKDVPNIDIFRV